MKVPKYIKKWLKLREHHAMMTITYDNKVCTWLENNGAASLMFDNETSGFFNTGAISLCENGSHLGAISAIENFQPKKGASK